MQKSFAGIAGHTVHTNIHIVKVFVTLREDLFVSKAC